MSFKIAHADDCETNGDWRLVRRTLQVTSFGVNVVEIAADGQIPEHDEIDRDQEELFYVLAGNPELVVDGEAHPMREGVFARVDPDHRRTIANPGPGPASVLIVSAPRSSGYQPMAWA